MAFTGNPATSATDRVRLMTGDTDPVYEFLDDTTYEYLIDKHNNNEKQAALEGAKYILAMIARFTRERTGDIEVYGNEFFKNYRAFLKDLIENPNFSTILATPYAGGISKEDMLKNDLNEDNVRPDVYKGFATDTHAYEEIQYDGPFES